MLTASELRGGIYDTLERAYEDHDPELSEAIVDALASSGWDRETFRTLAFFAWRAYESADPASAAAASASDLRGALLAGIRSRTPSSADLVERARLLGTLPVPWCDVALARETIAAAPDDATRIDVVRPLLRCLAHHASDEWAFRLAVAPHVSTTSAAAAGLVAAGYLELDPAPRSRHTMRESLTAGRDLLSVDDAFHLGVRFSIELRDELAADFARTAVARGLERAKLPIAAVVLWIAGARDEALEVVAGFDADASGWGTQAAESLKTFLDARAAPGEVREILAPRPAEGRLKNQATVGALVGRFALLRMRAAESDGRDDEAAREAWAVIGFHGYRGYVLHLQATDAEFDRRLVDRLAVTPDEVLEAHTIIGRRPDVPPPEWFLMEGRLMRRE